MSTMHHSVSMAGRLKSYPTVARRWFNVHIYSRLPGGWRTAALINTTLMSVVSILMIIFSVVALIQAQGFNKPLVFFDGSCGIWGATALNTVLHLFINIFSTAILASSNMFMQILSAPSREEVDKVHAKGSWLEIGILSARNIIRLSRFKRLSWLGFFLSSIPVHLLFNSTVVQTSYRFSHYDLAIAADPFVHDGTYRAPGASLLNSGGFNTSERGGYGAYMNITQYGDEASSINQNIASTARQGSTWTRLTMEACRQHYLDCDGLSEFSNVIFVVADTQGWPRSQIWNLTDPQASFYDSLVPDDAQESEHNSLWFYGKCAMSAVSENGLVTCGNSCGTALNLTEEFVIPFYPNKSSANYGIIQAMGNATLHPSPVYHWEHNNLTIEYCLAQPVQQSCKVALSTALLSCVTVCAVFKAILCVWVYRHLKTQSPLVTPGDAVDSFVSKRDSYTSGMCLVSLGESRMATFCGAPQPGPRKYRQRKKALGANVTTTTWFPLVPMTLCTLVPVIIFGAVSEQSSLSGGFGTSSSNPLTFSGVSLLTGVLIANSPQLVLSVIYVTYNNFLTRLLVGRAWAMRSLQYSSLRVSIPKGQQRSTYRLQLPYRYSVPLMIISGLLHWLMSNTIYIFISQGDYFTSLLEDASDSSYADPSLPPGSTVSVGYSAIALIILSIITFFGATIPLVWSRKRLPGSAIPVGCNSFVISTSCHVSTLAKPEAELDMSSDSALRGRNDSSEALELVDNQFRTWTETDEDEISGHDVEEKRLERIAQSRLKWGVVKMPDDWHQTYDESYGDVGHLSFGTTEDEVSSPRDGHWYA